MIILYIAEETSSCSLQCIENATSISEHQTISDHNTVDNGTELPKWTENTEEHKNVEAHCLNTVVSLPDNLLISAQKMLSILFRIH